MATGANGNDSDGNGNTGHALVYTYNKTGAPWNQVGGDIDGESADNRSGSSVSLSESEDGHTFALGNDNGNIAVCRFK